MSHTEVASLLFSGAFLLFVYLFLISLNLFWLRKIGWCREVAKREAAGLSNA